MPNAQNLSWGRLSRFDQTVSEFRSPEQWLKELDSNRFELPHGLGRSYGDVCLNDNHRVTAMPRHCRIISFDETAGTIRCESGTTLEDIIALVLPKGWFPSVVPGTNQVTVGGAIANDIHGKNHHVNGSFGHHLLAFELLRSDGSVSRCSATQNPSLFRATIGGLGLTGIVLEATLQLKRISGPLIEETTYKARDLDELISLSIEKSSDFEYTVAWLDCLKTGPSLGRGLLFCGEHKNSKIRSSQISKKTPISIPFPAPLSLFNRVTVGLFNAAYFAVHRDRVRYIPLQKFFFPLDRVGRWNLAYGPRGFFQYQCVLPMAGARAGMRKLLNTIASSGQASFLAVLKLFGRKPPAGMLSFPMEGLTLALDFPNRGERTLKLLNELDSIVHDFDGRLYPAKDARMDPNAFRRYFPNLETFEACRDPAFSSSFWRRVNP